MASSLVRSATRGTLGEWNTTCPAAAAWPLPTKERPSDSAGGTIAFEVEDLDRLMTDLKGMGIKRSANLGFRGADVGQVITVAHPVWEYT